MANVIIKANEHYEYEEVRNNIAFIMEKLGAASIIQPGQRVFLKANLLSKKLPEDAVTTHPSIVRAVAEYVLSLGASAIIGDSPGGPFTEQALRGIYQSTGMQQAAVLSGAQLNFDTSFVEVKLQEHEALERIEMVKAILDSDVVINLCKLKTHVMMTYTGAVKNLYGTIPGLTKAAYHMKLQEPQPFANHLIDICQKVKPQINLMDAVIAMEGDGPSNGEKRAFGYLLASTNPYALDYIACTMAGIDTNLVATQVEALRRNLLFPNEIRVDIDEEELNLDEFRDKVRLLDIQPFKLPEPMSVNFLHGKVPRFVEEFIVRQTKSKPIFLEDKCIGCSKCIQSCPAKIISLVNNKAKPNLKNCISCFCCHELCPVDAIDIHVPLLARVIFGERKR